MEQTFNPSLEQSEIIKLIVHEQKSVIVNGYAGFGKTTTALQIAKKFAEIDSQKRILLLTYNKELQMETEVKIRNLHLKNFECKTFHAFFGQQLSNLSRGTINGRKVINNDEILFDQLYHFVSDEVNDQTAGNYRSMARRQAMIQTNYDLVILDELQDCTPLFLIYLKKILTKKQQLLVMGDQHQTIYEYNHADNRIFKYINYFFPEHDFVCVFANHSMRIQKVQANLINYAIANGQFLKEVIGDGEWSLNRRKIITQKNNGSLCFLANFSASLNSRSKKIVQEVFQRNWAFIHEWIQQRFDEGYQPDDLGILLSNVQTGNPTLAFIRSILDDLNQPYVITDENSSSIEQERKIVVSTYHKFKGRERKCIILFNFSNEFYSNEPILESHRINHLNDVLYVGVTRAKEHLLICEDAVWKKEFTSLNVRNRLNFFPESFPEDCQLLGIEYHDFYRTLFRQSDLQEMHPNFDDDFYPKEKLAPGIFPRKKLNLTPSDATRNLPFEKQKQISELLTKHQLIKRYAGRGVNFELQKMNYVDKEYQLNTNFLTNEIETETVVTKENVARFNSAYINNEFWLSEGEPIYSQIWSYLDASIRGNVHQNHKKHSKVQEENALKFLAPFMKLDTELRALAHQQGLIIDLDDTTPIDDEKLTTALKLKIIVFQEAFTSANPHLLQQIDHYDWLDDLDLQTIHERLKTFMGQFQKGHDKLLREVPLEVQGKETKEIHHVSEFAQHFHLTPDLQSVKINARADFIVTENATINPLGDNHAVVELKFINDQKMGIAQIIQTLFYMWIINLANCGEVAFQQMVKVGNENLYHQRVRRGYLFNVKTNELIILQNNQKVIDQIFSIIFQAKLNSNDKERLSDDQFINLIQQILNNNQTCLKYLNALQNK